MVNRGNHMKTSSSHRSFRRIGAVLATAGLLVSACGGSDDTEADTEPAEESSSEPAAEPAAEPAEDETLGQTETDVTLPPDDDADSIFGGTLRYGLEADVNGLNPTASALSAPGLLMSNAVFDTLAVYNDTNVSVPHLAESFTASDDLMTWTMKLREGILFHDGTPLNAEAVLVNFNTQRSDPLVGLAILPFFPADATAATVIDDLTIEFKVNFPIADFGSIVTGQLGMVASPTWLAAAKEDPTLNQAPVGTGPFIFDSRSEDSVTRFVRNEDWWGGDVYLDAVEFYPVTDGDDRNDLLFNGDLDALQTTNQASIIDLIDDGSVQNVIDDTGEESFAMMNTAIPPFDDIRARQALAYASPIEEYVELIGLGVSRRASQRFTPESINFNPDLVQVGNDPDTAIALVAEYCAERGEETNPLLGTTTCTDGKINIELQWSGPSVVQTRIAELLDEAWSVGFNVTFQELPQDGHILQTAIGQYNVNTWRQFGAPDVWSDNVWLLCATINPAGLSLNWPRNCDEQRDALLFQATATADLEARAEILKQAEALINQAYTYIFFTHTTWVNSFAENVRGVCDHESASGAKMRCSVGGRTWLSSVWME